MSLMARSEDQPQAKELGTISAIMGAIPTISEKVLQDLAIVKQQPR